MSDEFFNLIYNKSLDLLSRREHSKKEIKEKLRLRFNEIEIIDNVISKLLETNLVNDKTNSFAAKYNVIKNKNIIKNRLNLAAIKLKRLHLLNKLQKKIFRKNGSYITFYFNF